MSVFKLQQFSVKQTISGMKICSDSLLFGAMIPVSGCKRILDIGAGTGILSLMLAQKCHELAEKRLVENNLAENKVISITAVEITPEAAAEAQENFVNSPWGHTLSLVEQDIQQFSINNKDKLTDMFDLIVCNPPFFSDHSKTHSDKALRHTARHTDSLSFADLCLSISQLLTASGQAYLLLPIIALTEFVSSASNYGLMLVERMDIAESEAHAPKVAVIHLCRIESSKQVASQANTQLSADVKRINKFKTVNVHSDEVQHYLSPYLLRYG
jgi:tRNA1Val (adenine37-N6)-methyltransferase